MRRLWTIPIRRGDVILEALAAILRATPAGVSSSMRGDASFGTNLARRLSAVPVGPGGSPLDAWLAAYRQTLAASPGP